MIHEPECQCSPKFTLYVGGTFGNEKVCICAELRYAYQRGREDECRDLNETKAYIVEPIAENLRRYKLLGWYLPGQAVTDLHSDGTVTLDGNVHWYGNEGQA